MAILDTGIDADHSHFANTVIRGDVVDTCGHGTAMAGIVVDVAPYAELMSIDVSTHCRTWPGTLAKGIRQVVDAGADVVLMAWQDSDSGVLDDAIAYAQQHGAQVVESVSLNDERWIAPVMGGGYTVFSGSSVTAANLAGKVARSNLFMPMVEH